MPKKSLVRITSKIKHNYLEVGDQYMGLLDNESGDIQFVLKNGYPTLYHKESFDIEQLSGFFGKEEFNCDRGQSL